MNGVEVSGNKTGIMQGTEKFGNPYTDMDGVKISGNKTGRWK
ncbi:MAG: hypothetical protein PG981_001192 [Wolbachia endosymbiont of Ctenocephalides orientis wCori]|nr:MAG: hypothetical protein PG981_001192 [Wolbachia endosymbiont of Ctenocephalides orientis wCori]